MRQVQDCWRYHAAEKPAIQLDAVGVHLSVLVMRGHTALYNLAFNTNDRAEAPSSHRDEKNHGGKHGRLVLPLQSPTRILLKIPT